MTGAWQCPVPLRDYPRVVTAHGGGGQLTTDLIEHLFTPAFAPAPGLHDGPAPAATDSAVLDVATARVAFTTDSYVVHPLEFPGGSIGDLAVNGTINDLAMSGARPLALSAGFVLEEGLEMPRLAAIAADMGAAARAAGVSIVTGDTKVVDAGRADGMYITTSGVGVLDDGVDVRPERMQAGDALVLSGPIGLHGVAVLSVREGLQFGSGVQSDTAPLHHIVADLLAAGIDIHAMRDLTRGGLAAGLCELATGGRVGIVIEEDAIPIPEDVASACGLFGLDPLCVANEGRFVLSTPAADADRAVAAITAHHAGRGAAVIGEVVTSNPGVVVQTTRLGARRVVERSMGEDLPRIC